MKKKTSFIIAVYNEADSLEKLYQEIKTSFLSLGNFKFEMIFIDDGSTDNTLEVLKNLRAEDYRIEIVRFRKNLGKSLALNQGFRKATGDIIVTLDADLQDDPANIKNLIDEIDKGYDMVIGWRQNRQDPVGKVIPSKIFNLFVRTFSGIALHDFNSGLKVMKKKVVSEIYLYGGLHRFIPVLAFQRGFRISEMRINHRPRKYGKSKFGQERLIRGYLDFLTVMYMNTYGQRPLLFFGLLGTASIIIGLIFATYLSILHFQGESIGRRPLLTFSILLILAGLQIFATGFIAEMVVRRNTKVDDKLPIDYETS